MIAYLLCAGFGTRMRPLTEDAPKSLLSVGDRPLLEYLLDDLRHWTALDAIHLAVNHQHAATYRTWAADRRASPDALNVPLHVHDDGVEAPEEQLGAVGDLQFLLEETGLPTDGALVSGGDSLYRFPLAPLLNGFDGTVNRVLSLHEPDRDRRRHSSILQLDGRRVTGLVEDPAQTASTRICPSFHLLTPAALDSVAPYLSAGHDPDTLGTFIDQLAREHDVRALPLPERPNLRLHCNTPEDLKYARRLLNEEPHHVLNASTVRGLSSS